MVNNRWLFKEQRTTKKSHTTTMVTLMSSSRRRSSRRSVLTKLLLIVSFLVFNSLSLFLYFSHNHHDDDKPSRHNSAGDGLNPGLLFPNLKPWPSLPSSLPWSHHPSPPRSCEAYFGNGFSHKIDVLAAENGWFRCFYSETLRSSVCEGGPIRMDPGRIGMSKGGEELEAVIGREEEEELPKFEEGAFQIQGGGDGRRRKVVDGEFLDKYVPRGMVGFHTMRELIGSIEVVPKAQLDCPQWIDSPTLLVTRFEYANVFHTVTDWYSAYVSSRVTNLPKRPDLVFVDGHCQTQLEETWKALFSGLRYAKNFTGPVCFRHAILSPLGYETAMFKGLAESFSCHGAPALVVQGKPDNRSTARISEFGEMIRAAFGLTVDDRMISKGASGHNVLFVRREDYLAHPRHNGKVQSRLSNEQEIYESLKSWSADYTRCKINLINGLFAHMPMKDQIQAIQEASVVIGAHGAGLTHLVAATMDTKVLELISSFYNRPHFGLISEWKGLEYHAIHLAGSYAEPSVVIKELSSIMRSLEC